MIKAFSTGKCDILSSGTHKKPSSRGEKEIEYKLKGNINSDFAHHIDKNRTNIFLLKSRTQQLYNYTNMDDGFVRPLSSDIFFVSNKKVCHISNLDSKNQIF